jgi:hypothetical protein
MHARLSHRDAVQCSVELTISRARQPMPLFVGRPHGYRCGAVESGEGVFGAEPAHLSGFSKDLGGGQRAAADDG